MTELPDECIDLIVTSPPYFNVKDYSKDGYQSRRHSEPLRDDIGALADYSVYLDELKIVWKECARVLKPNGKLAVNSPLMPLKKDDYNTHYNRHILNLYADIEHDITTFASLYLLDVYIWNRINATKQLMFGSYPFPRNFYAQNTIEFIGIYVKDGKPHNRVESSVKEQSKLSEEEWVEFTKQIWNIPTPNKSDVGFGYHSAIMPEEIAYRCIRLFTFEQDIVLDPFAGSGTTLSVASMLNRIYVGYEIYDNYKPIIEARLSNGEIFANQTTEQNESSPIIAEELLYEEC
ncbi:MAG: site-specific DNA-methyltransferase [Calditrichaeota bacterium]|nr:site-specific DNA-methyltransferase [Calditrichota bacterium]